MTKVAKTKFKETEIGAIPEEWDVLELEKFAELIKNTYLPNKSEELLYIGLEHINQQTLSLNSIGKSSDVKSNKFCFKDGDILFGKLRPYFRKVYRPKFSGICSTDIWVARAREGFDQGWLFYLLASEDFINFASGGSGGTRMPRADWHHLKNIKWSVPKFSEQKQIAETLSCLDDKIELNRKINDNLEKIASSLFKHWFVDFEFPNEECKPYKSSGGKMIDSELGEIPEGWRVSVIGKELQTFLGGTPSRQKDSYWINGTVPWVNSGMVNEYRIIKASEHITKEAVENSATKLLPKGTVVIAITGATLGQYSLLEIDSCFNQSVIGIKKNRNLNKEFVYYWIATTINELINAQTGGAQQHINKQVVDSHKILISNQITLDKYYKVAKPIFELISRNCFEIENLSGIRDSLLPRLMSGKIRVKI